MANTKHKGCVDGTLSRFLLLTFIASICWMFMELSPGFKNLFLSPWITGEPLPSTIGSDTNVTDDESLPSIQATKNVLHSHEPFLSTQATANITSGEPINPSIKETFPSINATNNVTDHHNRPYLPSIQGTNITGTASINAFREHLHCISEAGRWIYNPNPRHIPWNYAGHAYSTDCDLRYPGLKGEAAEQPSLTAQNWTVREALKWVWTTTNETCPLDPVNRDDFCKLLGSRGNMMVVGDSINHQIQVSITNNLIKDPNAQKIIRDEQDICRTCTGFPICGDVLGNGREFNVTFVRNDRLSAAKEPSVDHSNIEYPWMNFLKEWNIKTLLLNRGAHYQVDDHLFPVLNKTFSFIKNEHPDLLVIYRNTPPGHQDCLPDTPLPLEKRQTFSSNFSHHFWGDFARQNHLAKVLVEKFHFIYMDVDSMLSLRQDGHLRRGDCLHYCVPGPLDSAVQLLYNTLKAIARFST